jgi:hypothetical protein
MNTATPAMLRNVTCPKAPTEYQVLTASYADGSKYVMLYGRKLGNKHWIEIEMGDHNRVTAHLRRLGLIPAGGPDMDFNQPVMHLGIVNAY